MGSNLAINVLKILVSVKNVEQLQGKCPEISIMKTFTHFMNEEWEKAETCYNKAIEIEKALKNWKFYLKSFTHVKFTDGQERIGKRHKIHAES